MPYVMMYSAKEEAAIASRTRANIPNAAMVAPMANGVHCAADMSHYVPLEGSWWNIHNRVCHCNIHAL